MVKDKTISINIPLFFYGGAGPRIHLHLSFSKPRDASSHSVTPQWFHPFWSSRRFNPPSVSLTYMFMDEGKGLPKGPPRSRAPC